MDSDIPSNWHENSSSSISEGESARRVRSHSKTSSRARSNYVNPVAYPRSKKSSSTTIKSKKYIAKQVLEARPLNSDLGFRKNNKKKESRGCSSLADLKQPEIRDCPNLTPVPKESSLLLKPIHKVESKIGFQSSNEESRLNYVEQFDLLQNGILFNEWGKNLWASVQEEKQNAPSVPELSPVNNPSTTNKPFPLKRRTYSYGILSMKNSKMPSCEEENGDSNAVDNNKDVTQTTAKFEFDDGGSDYSSEDADGYESFENIYLENDRNTLPEENLEKHEDLSSTVSQNSSKSVLVVNEPVHVTFIDEETEQIKELMIFSDESMQKELKENNMIPRNEVLKKLLQSSQNYDGKALRILLDVKNHLSRLNNEKKPSTETWTASTSTGTKSKKETIKERTKDQSIKTQKIKKVCSDPCVVKTSPDETTNQPVNKWRTPFVRKFQKERSVPAESRSSETKFHYVAKKESADQFNHRLSKEIRLKTAGNSPNETNYIGDRKSRVAKKRVNVEEIIESDFKHFFHFYSKLGGRLKSGAVISKTNSNFWLRRCGIIFDEQSQRIAEDYFSLFAGKKLVINISEYVQYLTAVARQRRIVLHDIIHQLKIIKPYSPTNTKMDDHYVGSHSADDIRSPRKSRQEWKCAIKLPQRNS